MPLQIAVPIDVAEERPVALPSPRIVWPTMVLGESAYESGDLSWFPDEDSYRERYQRGIGGVISPDFRDAVRLAQHRFWVLDAQILRDSASTERLGELFYETGAWDLRVITASKEGAKEKAAWLRSLEAELQINSPDTPPRIKTFLDFSLTNEMPEIHDRFAIIDDVLWHCGATVGGLHNAINAMTFGWSANTTNAIAFFERLCEILGEFQ
jgi:hypothetical protein